MSKRLRRFGAILPVAGLLAVVLCPLAARAALVTVDWTGTVTGTPVPGTVDIGDTITGTYTYDSASPQSTVGAYSAHYTTNHDSSFSVNGMNGSFSNQAIEIYNDIPAGTSRDQIDTRQSPSQVYTGDLIDGMTPTQLFVRFTDLTQTAFSDVSLPSALDPSDFDNTLTSRIDFTESSINFLIDTFSARTTATGVPEPATLALLTVGLAGLGATRRRARRTG